MIETHAEVEIPKGFDFKQVEKELNKGLHTAAKVHQQEMETFIDNWANKPKFKRDEKKKKDRVSIFVYPTGENAKFWKFVSFGTEPHDIDPVRAPYLRFPFQGRGKSYVPKTLPGGGRGGPGVKLGPIRRFSHVDHPGIEEPRQFERETIKAKRKEFQDIMDDALEKGLEAAGS